MSKLAVSMPSAPKRRVSWWWLVAAGALAAAAAAVLVFVRCGSETNPKPVVDGTRVNAAEVALIVHVASDDDSRRVTNADTVQPGDQLRFEIHAPKAGYVAILGVDGTGNVTIYYPDHGDMPLALDPRTERLLPGAIELDATPGDERFYAIYAKEPFELATIAPIVKANGMLPAGLTKAEVTLHKQVPR